MDSTTLGSTIADLRKKNGYTQASLAKSLMSAIKL